MRSASKTHMKPRVLVLSQPSAVERRAHVTEVLAKHKIDFEFFDAVNGAQMSDDDAFALMMGTATNVTAEEKACVRRYLQLAWGYEAAIAASHLKMMHIAAQTPGWMVVLEDDAQIESIDAFRELLALMERDALPADVTHLLLSSGARKGITERAVSKTLSLVKYWPLNRGTTLATAMNQRGAIDILKRLYPVTSPIDIAIQNRRRLKIVRYGVSPSPVAADSAFDGQDRATASKRMRAHLEWHRWNRRRIDVFGRIARSKVLSAIFPA